ncbi:MAG: hypothetical protein LBU02_01515 [Rickettsiales bacterium]|jgi:hypothetical protein|nr:hypothetical protein [Rickettsiales bacterium]
MGYVINLLNFPTIGKKSSFSSVPLPMKLGIKTKDPKAHEKWERLDFDINQVKDNTGWTLLCFAAEKSYIKMAKALIENGADVNVLYQFPLHRKLVDNSGKKL